MKQTILLFHDRFTVLTCLKLQTMNGVDVTHPTKQKQKASDTLRKEKIMAEQLLTPEGVAKKLKISRTTFYDLRPRLIANGIKTMKVGKNIKYLESSIDALIRRCVETGQPMA